MKHYLMLPILLIAAAFSAQAQEKTEVNEKFFEAQIREYVYQLELSDEQKAAFIPVFKRYSEALKATFTKPAAPAAEKAVGEKPAKGERPHLTKEQAAARLKARIERQQKAQAVRLQFVDEFAEVLEPRQLMRIFEVEKDIQHKVKARQGGPQGGHGGQFHGGPNGGNRGQNGGGYRPGGNRSQGNE